MSTWMVVEDEPDIYEVLLAMFGIWGIEGVAFVDGEEAIAWIEDVDNKRFQGELPELALLDIRLPGEINGPAVGERLRKSEALGDIAIVLTTAYKLTPDEEAKVIKQAGADKLVYKPLPKFGELQTLLEGTISERRMTRAKANAKKMDAGEATIQVKEENEESVATEVQVAKEIKQADIDVKSKIEEQKTSPKKTDE